MVQRVTGSDWLARSVDTQRLASLRVGLLGATPTAADRLRQVGIQLVWSEHGNKRDWDPQLIAPALVKARIALLLVAVTPPDGDLIAAELARAGFDGTIFPVGGGVEMVTGLQPRAPRWVQRLNAEWLYRLLTSPRRLARRYLLECFPVFVVDILPSLLLRPNPRARGTRLPPGGTHADE
ncbi:WecB/TagA/CpsF family glycosyltransferase [uncultured Aeromicrobium sp.]|uniref:WecB/TagA/CpsF family glycosyltransferase n=1 Tax=uncultured Aeromicrobium sp. TaxID=337820 RepID=UPI003433C4B6